MSASCPRAPGRIKAEGMCVCRPVGSPREQTPTATKQQQHLFPDIPPLILLPSSFHTAPNVPSYSETFATAVSRFPIALLLLLLLLAFVQASLSFHFATNTHTYPIFKDPPTGKKTSWLGIPYRRLSLCAWSSWIISSNVRRCGRRMGVFGRGADRGSSVVVVGRGGR